MSLNNLWNLSPTPAPLGLGCDSHFVFLCRSVFTKNHTVPHTQVTRADHTIKACLEGITDRTLARFGAVIPRGDNQSTRGMDLLVVSQLRFLLGPVPFHTTSFPVLAFFVKQRWVSGSGVFCLRPHVFACQVISQCATTVAAPAGLRSS